MEHPLVQALWIGVGGFVGTEAKIEAFLPVIDSAIVEGLATIEKARIRFYRSGGETPS